MLETADKRIRRQYLTVLGILAVVLIAHDLYYPSSYEGADGLRHYLVSRYSWKHPELFFYSWGKPFFTLVSSPFSQFGLLGVKFFNLVCGLLTGWILITWRKEETSFDGIIRLLLLFSMPVYFFSLNSGYTEPLFGLFTIASVRLVLEGRSRWAAFLLSCLPYVRSEGYLFFPLFGLLFLLRRDLVSVLLLASFSVLLSLAGAPHFKSLLWIIQENPYDGTMAAIYGSGPPDHFIRSFPFMFGRVQAILIPLGILLMSWHWIRGDRRSEIWLVAGTFVLYFTAHMIFWWKGLFNSLGLLRVMAGVAPSGALVAWWMLDAVKSKFSKPANKKGVRIALAAVISMQPFIHEQFPLKLDPVETTVDKAIDWYNKEFSADPPPKIYYLSPYMGHRLNVDVFDGEKVGEMWGLFPSIREWGWGAVPDSTIILWDNQLAANEGLAPLDSFIGNPRFEELAYFKPEKEHIVLGGKSYEIRIFRKITTVEVSPVFTDSTDMEPKDVSINSDAMSNEIAFAGSFAGKLTSTTEFGVAIRLSPGELGTDPVNVRHIRLKSWFWFKNPEAACVWVVSLHSGGKQIDWKSTEVKAKAKSNGSWMPFEWDLPVDGILLEQCDEIRIYPWNKYHVDFYHDRLVWEVFAN